MPLENSFSYLCRKQDSRSMSEAHLKHDLILFLKNCENI